MEVKLDFESDLSALDAAYQPLARNWQLAGPPRNAADTGSLFAARGATYQDSLGVWYEQISPGKDGTGGASWAVKSTRSSSRLIHMSDLMPCSSMSIENTPGRTADNLNYFLPFRLESLFRLDAVAFPFFRDPSITIDSSWDFQCVASIYESSYTKDRYAVAPWRVYTDPITNTRMTFKRNSTVNHELVPVPVEPVEINYFDPNSALGYDVTPGYLLPEVTYWLHVTTSCASSVTGVVPKFVSLTHAYNQPWSGFSGANVSTSKIVFPVRYTSGTASSAGGTAFANRLAASTNSESIIYEVCDSLGRPARDSSNWFGWTSSGNALKMVPNMILVGEKIYQ